jgi:serine acetyltransferase
MDNYINKTSELHNFHTPQELINEVGGTNSILTPYATLISRGVIFGKNNIIYPNVVIERTAGGQIEIGDNNTFFPGAYILGSAGLIKIGNNNEFGPAGITIQAKTEESLISIGDNGRYNGNPNIIGHATLGSGSQILGNIVVQDCQLAGGASFKEPLPDKRAAVLKGFGIARNLILGAGQVINGAGNFSDAPLQWQREYHS